MAKTNRYEPINLTKLPTSTTLDHDNSYINKIKRVSSTSEMF